MNIIIKDYFQRKNNLKILSLRLKTLTDFNEETDSKKEDMIIREILKRWKEEQERSTYLQLSKWRKTVCRKCFKDQEDIQVCNAWVDTLLKD